MGRLVTAPTHALLRTHRGRPDTGTRQHIAVADTGLTYVDSRQQDGPDLFEEES